MNEYEYNAIIEGMQNYPTLGRRLLSKMIGISERKIEQVRHGSAKIPVPTISISGLTAEPTEDPKELLSHLISQQVKKEHRLDERYKQEIVITDQKPIAIAFLSDWHIGSPNCNYRGLASDVDTIKSTPGMYAISTGDYHDNWICASLAHLQQKQSCSLPEELALTEYFFQELADKLLCVVAGNHDARTVKAAGIHHIKQMLRHTRLLYDDNEVNFKLSHSGNEYRIKCRHAFKGKSIYNATHGQERDLKFGDYDWDIAVSGHTHVGTLMREFIHQGKFRYAIQVGTYKFDDDYGRQLGCHRTMGGGCAALIFVDDGQPLWCPNLRQAAYLLRYLRNK